MHSVTKIWTSYILLVHVVQDKRSAIKRGECLEIGEKEQIFGQFAAETGFSHLNFWHTSLFRRVAFEGSRMREGASHDLLLKGT
jgi:hypothetical protein